MVEIHVPCDREATTAPSRTHPELLELAQPFRRRLRVFLRRRDKETKQFLRYAIDSNGELKACYYAAVGRAFLTAADTSGLIELNESISRMLRRWDERLGPKDQARTTDQRTDQEPGTKH